MDREYAVPPTPAVELAIEGSPQVFPVHRVYCVGRNYADHVREMGSDPRCEPPVFFSKPADALVPSGTPVRYPPRTQNLHHEIELVVALGSGGRELSVAAAPALVLGYAVGNDLTRRDLQAAAKKAGQPWDVAKGFDASAPVSPLRLVEATGPLSQGRIWLEVNGVLRQQADIADMIWSVPEIIAELSTYFELKPGDLIFTGTPAGVGALLPGDRVRGGVDGVGTLEHGIVAP